jgi:hypothetical protein
VAPQCLFFFSPNRDPLPVFFVCLRACTGAIRPVPGHPRLLHLLPHHDHGSCMLMSFCWLSPSACARCTRGARRPKLRLSFLPLATPIPGLFGHVRNDCTCVHVCVLVGCVACVCCATPDCPPSRVDVAHVLVWRCLGPPTAVMRSCRCSGLLHRIHGDTDHFRGGRGRELVLVLVCVCCVCVFVWCGGWGALYVVLHCSCTVGCLDCQFPYYTFKNKEYMYKVGSACYGIYFIVTFPMYFR